MRCPFLWFPCMSQATLATLATQNLRAQPRLLLSAPFPFLLTLQKQNFNFLYGGLTITDQKSEIGSKACIQVHKELHQNWPDHDLIGPRKRINVQYHVGSTAVGPRYNVNTVEGNTRQIQGRVVVLVRPWTLEPAGQLRKASADSRHLIQCAACTQYRHALHMVGW